MKRKLGAFGPEISAIVYGAWQAGGWWWGPADDDAQIRAMHAAFDAGVNAVDTAPVYGFGHSEEVVGRAVRGRPDIVVMTKCGLTWSGDAGSFFFDTDDGRGGTVSIRRHSAPDVLRRECEASLRRLGVEAIDVWQLHWPEPERAPEEVMATFEALRREGKIKAIGVSNCGPDWMARARAVAPLTSHQPKWSFWSRTEERTSIAWSRDQNIAAIVYSPLEQGLLTGKLRPDTTFRPGDNRAKSSTFKPQNIEAANRALDTLRPLADRHGCSLAQLVLAATIAQPGITAAIVGARDPEQAVANAAAMRVAVSEADVAEVRRVFEAAKPARPRA